MIYYNVLSSLIVGVILVVPIDGQSVSPLRSIRENVNTNDQSNRHVSKTLVSSSSSTGTRNQPILTSTTEQSGSSVNIIHRRRQSSSDDDNKYTTDNDFEFTYYSDLSRLYQHFIEIMNHTKSIQHYNAVNHSISVTIRPFQYEFDLYRNWNKHDMIGTATYTCMTNMIQNSAEFINCSILNTIYHNSSTTVSSTIFLEGIIESSQWMLSHVNCQHPIMTLSIINGTGWFYNAHGVSNTYIEKLISTSVLDYKTITSLTSSTLHSTLVEISNHKRNNYHYPTTKQTQFSTMQWNVGGAKTSTTTTNADTSRRIQHEEHPNDTENVVNHSSIRWLRYQKA